MFGSDRLAANRISGPRWRAVLGVGMLTLGLIGLVGGLITGISPCVLPVLPVIFLAGGAQAARTSDDTSASAMHGRQMRPFAVVAGLALSFSLFTLLGALVLKAFRAGRGHPLGRASSSWSCSGWG